MQYPQHIRDIKSPLTDHQLQPLDPQCRIVQFSRPLKRDEYSNLSRLLRDYPQVTLRIYGFNGLAVDLDFLSHFRFVKRFQADIFHLDNLDGLRHLPENLEFLGLGQTESKRHSLSVLRQFRALRELYLDGHSKDFEVVGDLKHLEYLTIRSVTLPDLSLLMPLTELRSLDIKLGGTANLELLPKVGRLRYLELWMIRGLSDLSPIEGLRDLQYLFLQALRNVTALPSLRKLKRLRRLHLQTMKGLKDIEPIADAPALEELLVGDLPQLSPESFRPIVGHPLLKFASVGLGSHRKNQAVEAMLGLPPAPPDSAFVFQ